MNGEIHQYFAGTKLYGVDFAQRELDDWFRDEELAYFQLDTRNPSRYRYSYHAIDRFHAFRYLPAKDFCAVLGIGSGYGHEFRPILTKISGDITILEPAAGFRNNTLDSVALHYVMPRAGGVLPFDDCRFDLIVCFSVLHHIPNEQSHERDVPVRIQRRSCSSSRAGGFDGRLAPCPARAD